MNLYKVILCGMALIVLGLAVATIFPQYTRREEARRKLEDINREYEVKKNELERKRAYLSGLENDPAVIEKIARERHGFSRPGETIIIFKRDGEKTRSYGS